MRFERKRQEYVKGLYEMRMPKVNKEPVEVPVEVAMPQPQKEKPVAEVTKHKYKVGDIVWAGRQPGRICCKRVFGDAKAYEVLGMVEGWIGFYSEGELSPFTLENE